MDGRAELDVIACPPTLFPPILVMKRLCENKKLCGNRMSNYLSYYFSPIFVYFIICLVSFLLLPTLALMPCHKNYLFIWNIETCVRIFLFVFIVRWLFEYRSFVVILLLYMVVDGIWLLYMVKSSIR